MNAPMRRVSTNILRVIICLMGIGVLALCIFALPSLSKVNAPEFPLIRPSFFLIMISLYLTVIPFFIGVWQTFKLLRNIDQNKTFSETSVIALRNIKRCAISIGILYWINVPLLFPFADADDAPGVLPIGAAFASIPFVFAVFVAILQSLLQSAMDLKSENDLTV